jgi:hypothetical protein
VSRHGGSPLDAFARFREIVLPDTEFIARPGELYEPVCLAFEEVRSGRKQALWCTELGDAPPHATGSDVLVIGFTAAEPEFYFSRGWQCDFQFIDLRVEHINATNIAWARDDPRRHRPPRSLIDILSSKGIRDGDAAYKEAMRLRIMAGGPFTDAEIIAILAYCQGDVSLLARLFEAMIPDISGRLEQALRRGAYVKATAAMFVRGIPADPWSESRLRQPEKRQAIRMRAVSDESLTGGVYTGTTLQQAKLREFLVRHRIRLAGDEKGQKAGHCRPGLACPRRTSARVRRSAGHREDGQPASRAPTRRRQRRALSHAAVGLLDDHQPHGGFATRSLPRPVAIADSD